MAYKTAKWYRDAADKMLNVALEDEAFNCDTMMRVRLRMATILEAKAIAMEKRIKEDFLEAATKHNHKYPKPNQ